MDTIDDCEEYSDDVSDELRERTEKLFKKFEQTDDFKQLSDEQQEEASFILSTFTDYMYGYYVQQEKDWEPFEVEDCCLDVLPRKVSADDGYYKAVAPVLVKYFDFLATEGVINNSEELKKVVQRIDKKILKNSRDPACWGMAKSMFMGAHSQGYDLFDEEEMAEYIEEYNQSISLKNIKPYHAPEKIGRNDPCICGSGKKYKKCCINKSD